MTKSKRRRDAETPTWRYSPEQRAAIAAALDPADSELAIKLLEHEINNQWPNEREVAGFRAVERAEVQAQLEAIERAIEVLIERGRDSASLEETAEEIRQELAARDGWINHLRATASGNNLRPFTRDLLKMLDRIWTRSAQGRAVDHGARYAKFFEAVVRPVLMSPEIRLAHNVSWTEGMLRNHVSKVRSSADLGRSKTRPIT